MRAKNLSELFGGAGLVIDRAGVRFTAENVFPGVAAVFVDAECASLDLAPGLDGLGIIVHCREGQCRWRGLSLTPGSVAVARLCSSETAEFPGGVFRGAAIVIAPELAPDCFSCFLQDVNVRPAAIFDKFCTGAPGAVIRANAGAQHIFSELYSVPEDIRTGYLKVKTLELLLLLSSLPAPRSGACTGRQSRLAREAGEIIMHNLGARLTAAAVAEVLGVSAAQLDSSFRAFYGMSPAAFLRAQRMHEASRLLRGTSLTVMDVAGRLGYDNPSKFARAFRAVTGVSPSQCRENT